jgi:hypothetical protein
MKFEEYIANITNSRIYPDLTPELQALWQEKNGCWDKAHSIIQNEQGKFASLIHAYLHRKEGDIWNANYWYERGKEKMPEIEFDAEWENLVKRLTNKQLLI